jgi:exodeoxyribonuclease V gamma subunit
VQRRYRIEDFDALLDMVERSQIRWGLDESDWRQSGVDTRQNTWAFGLDRLFAGYAYGDDGPNEAVVLAGEPVAPLHAGGSNAAQDIGALSRFVHNLQELVQLRRDRTADQWRQHIDALIDHFFETDDIESTSANRIRAAMQTLSKQTALAKFDSKISYEVVRDYLEQALDSKSQGQQYFNGAITFCTLMPMRSLPFAVVCMLGLNDATFPRRQNPVSFDLMAAQPRKGDRNRRHEDRYLFLEAVLAAREQLYISYIGHSIVDNSPREPSVLVSELIEMLCRYPGVSRDTLVCQHPLQAFDARYFAAERKNTMFSYAVDWVPAAKNSQLPLQAKKPFDFSATGSVASAEQALRQVELDELLDWASQPSRHVLRKLGIELVRRDDQLLDEENFDADGLLKYQLAHEGVDAAIERNLAFDSLLQRWSVAGMLPVGAVGRAVADSLQQSLQPFVQLAAGAGRFDARKAIDIVVGNFRIAGVIGRLGDNGRFEARYSALKGRNLLPAWLQHLLLSAAGSACSTRLLLRDADVRFAPVCADEALVWLTNLLDVYARNMDSLQPVFVDLSYAIAEHENAGDDQKIAGSIEKFHTDDENSRGLYSDEHDSYLFGVRPVADDEDFIAVARLLFGGIFAYMSCDKLDADATSGEVVG